MSVDILINVTAMETRVAFVEQGRLQEIMLERKSDRGIVGNIYKGKVVRILPGMQAAFVDIGRDRAGFLHATDIVRMPLEEDGQAVESTPDIRQLLHDGQIITVQVYKDPIGTKGPRLTTMLSLSSRYLVFMPGQQRIGVSQKIVDEAERDRLRELITRLSADQSVAGGFIVRTLAEECDETELAKEISYLQMAWQHLESEVKKHTSPGLVHQDLPLSLRVLRDIAGDDIDKIMVDDDAVLGQLKEFVTRFTPDMKTTLELYQEEMPLFSNFGLDDEINKALDRKVPLISGGYLVIDQTEAMTTIDVNTGAFVGHRNLEDTIVKTNLEAAFSIARQLRLRNLGGIIIVDFIDMDDAEHQREVLRVFEKSLARDRARTTICEISSLGLVEMTRKRTSQSLEQMMCVPCEVCEGRGSIKSVETVSFDILREISAYFSLTQFEKLLVVASTTVIEHLLDEASEYITGIEEELGRPIEFRVETAYTQEQYDIVPL